MAIQRTGVRKKNTKKEITLPSIGETPSGRNGEVRALVYFMCSVMITIALFTFDVTDSGINSKGAGENIHNALGIGGAYISSLLVDFFGVSAWFIPLILFGIGYHNLASGKSLSLYKTFGVFLSLILGSVLVASTGFILGEEKAGGLLGDFLYSFMSVWLGNVGVYVILFSLVPIVAKMAFNISVLEYVTTGYTKLRFRVYQGVKNNSYENYTEETVGTTDATPAIIKKMKHLFIQYWPIKHVDKKTPAEDIFNDLLELPQYDVEERYRPKPSEVSMKPVPTIGIPAEKLCSTQEPIGAMVVERDGALITESTEIVAEEYMPSVTELPHATLLGKAPNTKVHPDEIRRMQEVGERIIACLEEFKVKADLIGFTPGPVVTQYEIRPHAGVRVSKVKNLGDDLALKLEATSVRIQAPIPETDLIGIEVPNKKRQAVYFQELINSEAFREEESLLTMALGKTTSGAPFFADLAQMPHLLVAGATGAGKSVCLNSIILSFLYKASPKEVKLLLIDPKRVELKTYQDLPHLIHPVVTDMELARSALQWAVEEMEHRYSLMERMGSKDLTDFNAKVRRIISGNAERAEVLQEFPYLVIIIDELADLILTATKEVETNITRLSQLARAAGIHLILATQRPSVDVVTALIKANFPSRIAFRVTSRHDSGTILDTIGAEKLLGKGDMLFKTTHIQRLHGAFVSTDEVEAVVEYWKSKERPEYAIDFVQWQQAKAVTTTTGMFADENDPQYQEAIQFVYERGEASISSIQRRFRIGFNKAARYVEQMEQSGILENAGGAKRRVVRNAL